MHITFKSWINIPLMFYVNKYTNYVNIKKIIMTNQLIKKIIDSLVDNMNNI